MIKTLLGMTSAAVKPPHFRDGVIVLDRCGQARSSLVFSRTAKLDMKISSFSR
jgi:hypothetical protein